MCVRWVIKFTGWDRLHDLVGLDLIVNLKSEEIFGGSQLELGDAVFLVLLDGDLFGTWETLLLSSHDLNEFLQVLDFLGLHAQTSDRNPLTYHLCSLL